MEKNSFPMTHSFLSEIINANTPERYNTGANFSECYSQPILTFPSPLSLDYSAHTLRELFGTLHGYRSKQDLTTKMKGPVRSSSI